MSCCHVSVPREVRPGTARVLVPEPSGSGHINLTPAPKPREDYETATGLYLSKEKLESVCGTRDLSKVTSLEIRVDTQENTLGNFGDYLPRLLKLKMNNSNIMSVRDLGTTLSHLQVLWMSRCSLQDLTGICAFTSLKELYVAYNNVSDLSQLGMLENLQLLDLEGNNVDDIVQIQYLGLCGKLQTLSLEGNPVCAHPNPTAIQTAGYSYRAAVRKLVPQLRYLNDLRVEEDGLSSHSTMGEDWAILRDCIRDGSSSQAAAEYEDTADRGYPYSRPAKARRPAHNVRSGPKTATRPGVLSGSRPGSADSDLATVEAEASVLTHGAGKILFCGNPVQAVRARREKLRTAPTRSTFTLRDLPIHVPEHTNDLEETDVRERIDVFAELRAWREQHGRRLQAIKTERLPQVLAICYSDEEKGGDDNKRKHEAEMHRDRRDAASPDSPSQFLSPGLHPREAFSSEAAGPSLSPGTTLSPSPPPSGDRKPTGLRARRLRLSQTNSEHTDFSRAGRCPGAETTPGDTHPKLQGIQQLTKTNKPLSLQPAYTPRPPPTRAPEMDSSSKQAGRERFKITQMSKLLDRPAITRPHTFWAALQKHHQHLTNQPCRGSPHSD
uniref:LOW QUALITY PROTEIN: leucine-rich repeat-containing protein 56-like n=1 Tax=Gasterosteus aculeatus aculeatus TaxID=481459 RepID=UPI001A9A14D6|nr:LOW QUALITY PROTEIN: leucine-rich repeat-containing protein 56-like [Gasterosteus aculeatus aculeatus]